MNTAISDRGTEQLEFIQIGEVYYVKIVVYKIDIHKSLATAILTMII